MIASFPFLASSFDNDARTFINTSGAIDRAVVNYFVKGIKRLGLWDDMVCWPLRSAQNAGTGSTAYSLGGLGTYNGTLVNGPTWGVDGVNFTDDSNQSIDTTFAPNSTDDHIYFAVIQCNSEGAGFNYAGSTRNGSSGGYSYATNVLGNFRSQLWDIGSNHVFATSAAITDGTYHSAAYKTKISTAIKETSISIDAGSQSSASGTITQNAPASLKIGAEGNDTRSFNGNFSFAAFFKNYNASIAEINALYKSTLGQGLGLP
jgi:hypothetical protein